MKAAVPSLNSLPENPKPVHPLGSSQLVCPTQGAQFVRGRQFRNGKVALICDAVDNGVYI